MIEIDGKYIGAGQPVYIIAEMSANHNMDYERAVELIRTAKEMGADAVKIQTYTADTITIDCDKEWFMTPSDGLWSGMTLHDLYKTAYTPWEWQPKLMEVARELGITLFSSPFDLTAVDFLEKMEVPAYKVASYEINDIPLIRKIAETGKPIIISTGIAYPEDIKLAIDTCKAAGNDKIILLKCTSAYPSPYEDMNLNVIPLLAEDYGYEVGLSDHSMDDEVAIAAVALGARVIEKHFTIKRSDGGADSAFSMEVEEFAAMVRRIRNVEKALGKATYELTKKQVAARETSRSLFVVSDVKKGDIITSDNCRSIRPGIGMHTKHYDEILGKKFNCDLEKGTPMDFKYVE